MKKCILAAVVCAALLLALLPGTVRAADDKLSFISVNDTLPPELINVAVYYGSRIYVPYWLFTNYRLGLSYSYFSDANVALLSGGGLQMFFELSTGKTYDGDGYAFSVSAIMSGGTVYLPLTFLSSFFGTFTYANIGGNEYGDIFRITTGSEVLTNSEFLNAAGPAMKRYYEAYRRAQETPTPSASPAPSPTPTPISHVGDTIRLGLEGVPTQPMLELLHRLNMRACFFLTAEEVRGNPDMVRAIACSGQTLGIGCVDGASYEETAALLFECARVRSVMAAAPESAELPAEAVALPSVREAEGDAIQAVSDLTEALEASVGNQTVLYSIEEENLMALRMLLYALRDQGYTVTAIRETDGAEPVLSR